MLQGNIGKVRLLKLIDRKVAADEQRQCPITKSTGLATMEKQTAVLVTKFVGGLGDLSGVEVGEKAVPQPKGNEVLVKLQLRTLNPADVLSIAGAYMGFQPEEFPAVPGIEGRLTLVHSVHTPRTLRAPDAKKLVIILSAKCIRVSCIRRSVHWDLRTHELILLALRQPRVWEVWTRGLRAIVFENG
jgi:hypothetical protein